MSKLPVEDSFLKKELPFLFLIILGLSIFSFVIYPYFIRFSKQTCAITEKGIKLSGDKNILYRWNRINDYSIEDSPNFPSLKILTFTFGRKQENVFLSDEFPMDRALTILSSKIIKQTAKQETKLSFSKAESIYIFSFFLICSGTLVYYASDIIDYMKMLGEWVALVFLLVLFFGPGTLVVFQLRGFRNFKSGNSFSWSVMLNLFFVFICMIIGLIIVYIETYKFFN